ncbi:MAG: tyrosine-type recombinase/integrase [Ignavibacteriaceae bacterium]
MFLSKRKGIYQIYYEGSNGKRTSVSTKTKYKSEALNYLSEFSNKIKEDNRKGFISISLKDFRFEYLKYSESYHTWRTTLTYKTTFNSLLDYFGNVPLTELIKKKIEEYIQYKIRNVSLYCARKDLINIKASLNWGLQNNYLIENPSKDIKRIKTPEILPKFFSKVEFQKLLDIIDKTDLKDLVIFAVNTGLRQSELLNLRFKQINFNDKSVILDNQGHITKSKKVRTVPLNDIALNIIHKRYAGDLNNVVFTLEGSPIKQDFIVHKFKKYVRLAEINPKLNFHSLRHTFASWLVQKGVSIFKVSKLLGHADVTTTQIYAHLNNEDLKGSVDLLNL